MATSVQNLKASLIKFVDYMVKCNTTQNTTYEQMANTVWAEEIQPFLVNENITTWEIDIKKKFIDNPYVRFNISEKQAYCLAKAFANINPETIIF
jgi:hypothetical protein